MCLLRFRWSFFVQLHLKTGNRNSTEKLFGEEKNVSAQLYVLMDLFCPAHFLHRITILSDPWVKVLRDRKQTAELYLLKWYWTSEKGFYFTYITDPDQTMAVTTALSSPPISGFWDYLSSNGHLVRGVHRGSGAGGRGLVSVCKALPLFLSKGDISSPYLIYPDQWLGLRRFLRHFLAGKELFN